MFFSDKPIKNQIFLILATVLADAVGVVHALSAEDSFHKTLFWGGVVVLSLLLAGLVLGLQTARKASEKMEENK